MDEALKTFINTVISFCTQAGLKLIAALLVLTIGLKLAKFITKKIINSKGAQKLEISVRSFLNNALLITLDSIVVITAALIIGIPGTAFITLLGTAGVAIGLALQGAFSNFAGGLMILIFHPFKVGHYIESDGMSGTVKEISIFYTVLKTIDNKNITIPNGTLMNASVINYSAEDTRRVDLVFPLSHDTDSELVKSILLTATENHELSLKDPAPFARITAQTRDTVEFTLRVWCKTNDFWTLKLDLLENIKNKLEENGIKIPYQQLDVHLDK